MQYQSFLQSKQRNVDAVGFDAQDISNVLYPFQQSLVRWAVRRGRAAIFADCGLGKTLMQLEWARHMGKRVLIVAPLCVAEQTIAEAQKLDMTVQKIAHPVDGDGVFITNYEKLKHFVDAEYDAIVLDESSILKSLDGKTRTLLLSEFTHIPYRLCCTATPAPNDIVEIGNHAEFLGIMKNQEMRAMYFVNDASDQKCWRLRGHAHKEFYEWMTSWCMFVREPADIGFNDDRFLLPDLHMNEHIVRADFIPEGFLIPLVRGGLSGRNEARRKTIETRCEKMKELVATHGGQWLIWCGLNDEGRQIKALLGDKSVLIEGQDDEEKRINAVHRWKSGDVNVLISKPSIFGYGMNFQNCHHVGFLGLGDSWESYYQAIRRCWRFGQQRPVDVHIVISDAEDVVLSNIQRKERQVQQLYDGILNIVRDIEKRNIGMSVTTKNTYNTDETQDAMSRWKLMLGDCVDRIKEVETGSVGLSVFSPPFASLYTYSDSDRDMGNSKSYEEFFEHFKFLIPELLRVTMPGRRACVHVQQVSLKKSVDGFIGWYDFRADTVAAFNACGWIYDGEVVIDKDPQVQAIRTKSKQLLFAQLKKDSSWSRPGMADYIVLFRAPGDNPNPVKPDIDNELWIRWARPIWYGIKESDTLQASVARDDNDERHICPLQLETIERCIRLWSNQGDLICSPFAGIGSEGYQALLLNRRFVGIELKESYYRTAINNLRAASQPTLFDAVESAS